MHNVHNVKCDFCRSAGWVESDYAPGTFYPCSACNPRACTHARVRYDRDFDGNPEKHCAACGVRL